MSIMTMTYLGLMHSRVCNILMVLGLVIGGLFAAPFAAMVTKRLNTRTLLILVGVLISVVSLFNLYKALLV